ncbi:MAG: hypothetical protein ACRBB0_01680 [Pelagimonas sp.]|uniref:hypothetical protein n=1 Tax=Pelagimonas sp. TaxID=2073170 RepID=UPI003D6ACBF7
MEEPLWLQVLAFSPLAFIVIAVIYRLRKKHQIQSTLKQLDSGNWEWTDRKGRRHVTHTNPLDEMKKDGEEAHRDWHRNN